ncbi:MAG: 1-acyl-sn-glycerol-3-phosphate acyltransferase [Prevotella sp.]|nr:1-acyl-sn-glycerol-3-phosphate acyltransferase [Prevotella sp.]
MNIPAKFDPIRSYEPEELPAVYDRLIADPQFRAVMEHVFSGVPYDALAAKIRSCRTNLDFQKQLCYGFLASLLVKVSDGCTMDSSRVDVGSRYTFMSNHRDIVLDSAFLDKMLVDAGFGTTCEIAIGDNLLAAPWIEDLVRVNKSFIVRRSAAIKEMLANSRLLSEYMHFVIAEKHDNVWIAQREGRAKDSDDRTQQSLLKMMAMGGEGSVAERLAQLHIVPLAISYEYDPCDYLKAREFQLKRDVEGWKKTKADDVMSMQTGIMGRKGRIHYHCAPCIDGWLGTLPEDMPKGELFAAVARHIDREIHLGYRLYPNNYAAADLLRGNRDFADRYTSAERTAFEEYIAGRIALIDLPEKDEDYLRERLLTMYANPAINQMAALEETV